MKRTTLTAEQALERARALPFAYIAGLSSLTLGPVPAVLEPEEIMEARFFGPLEEVHLYHTEAGLEAVSFAEEPGDEYLEQESPLISGFGKTLTKRMYVDYDEDGQARIVATRLVNWEG